MMVLLTIGIIVGLCDLILPLRPLAHGLPWGASLCGMLWFHLAANLKLFLLFPALLLETSFGHAGFATKPHNIAKDRSCEF